MDESGKRTYKIYKYKNMIVFGTKGLEIKNLSSKYEIIETNHLPKKEIFALSVNDNLVPIDNTISNCPSEKSLFFFRRWFTETYLGLFICQNDFIYGFKYPMYEEQEKIKSDRKLWVPMDKDKLKEMIFDDNILFCNWYIRRFPTEHAKNAFFNQNDSNERIEDIAKNYNYNIFVDGAHSSKELISGWAFVIYDRNMNEIFYRNGVVGDPKFYRVGSSLGEYLAMYHAHLYFLENRLDNIAIFYDNVRAREFMNEEDYEQWRMRIDKFGKYSKEEVPTDLLELNKRYNEAMSAFNKEIEAKKLIVDYYHSKGHKDIKGNCKADRLAKRAIIDFNNVFKKNRS